MRKLSSKTRRRPLRFFRLTISSRTRREINRNAKAAASRNWTPSETQPEPHWVVEWDGEIKAAIADGISRFETSVTTVLQTIAHFNDTTEVCLPPVLERTPEARRIFLAHAHYAQLRHDANAAVVSYEQRRQSLIRDIKANLDLSEVGRGAFYSKMSEFHPRPELIDDRNSTPLTWTDIGLASRAVLERSQLTIDRARLKLGLDEAELPAAASSPQATLTHANHPDPTPLAELSILRSLENGS